MLSPILLYACLTYIESVETIYLAVIVILKHALDQLPEGALIDGRRARVGKKGGVSATAAAISAATEKLDIAIQESSEIKSLIVASFKQQNGAAGSNTHVSETEENLRLINADMQIINTDMQIINSLEKARAMISSLTGKDSGDGDDEEGGYEHLSKRKRERLEALCAIEDRLLKSAKRRK